MGRAFRGGWLARAGEWEQWMQYALEGGGKRLRPKLVWETYRLYALHPPALEEALPAMRAIELVHTFTLVHDDVMDRSDLRRGCPTLHKLTDEHTAILIGDALMIAAYEALADLKPSTTVKILRHLAREALRVCYGQLLDSELAKRPTAAVRIEDYLRTNSPFWRVSDTSCKMIRSPYWMVTFLS